MPQHKIITYTHESEPDIQLQYIGRYIREFRICEGLTQVEAAKMIGISESCLQKVEYGNNFTIATLFKISDTYDLRITDFFSELD